MTRRLRRSFLYTPADDRSMMENAAETVADAVIFDLEDAIPDATVPDARTRIADVTAASSFGDMEVCVRINGFHTDLWLHDLLAIVASDVDTVVLPMVESPQQLATVVSVARQTEGSTPEFIVTIETPTGLFAAADIATAATTLSEVTGFSFGFGDYTKAIGATGRPQRVHDFISHVTVGAAAAGGLAPIATVYQDFQDTEGLRRTAQRAHEIGYIGQKAIHPTQLAVINDVFTPTQEKVAQAQRFVDAFEDSSRDSIVVEGVFLDTAIVDQYRTVLDRHVEVNASS